MTPISLLRPPPDDGGPATTAAQVASARLAAVTASASGHDCWDRYAEALAGNAGVDRTRHELMAAIAEQTYAWAVYHCTAADAADGATEHPTEHATEHAPRR